MGLVSRMHARLGLLLPYARRAGIYAIGNFANGLVPFILLPVFTRVLSKEDFARVTFFTIFTQVLLPFVGLNSASLVGVDYYRLERRDLDALIRSSILCAGWTTMAVAAVVSILYLFAPKQILPLAYWDCLAAVTIALGVFLVGLALAVLQMQEKPIAYGAVRISQTILELLTSLGFILLLNLSYRGRILGQMGAVVLVGVVMTYVLFRGTFSSRPGKMRDIVQYGLPLLPHSLVGVGLVVFDRLVVLGFGGMSQFATYSAGFQLGQGMSVLESALVTAWLPVLYKMLGQKNSEAGKRKIVLAIYGYSGFLICTALVLGLAGWFVAPIFLGEKYAEAGIFTLLVSLSFGFNGVYKAFMGFQFYEKRTGIISIISSSCLAVHVAVTLSLVHFFGVLGAAVAFVIMNLCMAIATACVTTRTFALPWSLQMKVRPNE